MTPAIFVPLDDLIGAGRGAHGIQVDLVKVLMSFCEKLAVVSPANRLRIAADLIERSEMRTDLADTRILYRQVAKLLIEDLDGKTTDTVDAG